mmetsp:Transcript_117803/g.380153  ORF Transcript_117803/g.380153 Transcript_117803/m.380153 type:complete len:269 (+) Transcript_117803:1015-1821(+)
MGEALDHRAVRHRIDYRASLRVCQHLLDQGVCALWVTIGCKGLHQATQSDAREWHAAGAHLTPSPLDALNVAHTTICAYDAAEGLCTLHLDPAIVTMPPQLTDQQIIAVDADARLQCGAEQHLVHVVVHVLHDGQRPVSIHGPGAVLHTLQQNGAGDAVGLQATGLHLADQGPSGLQVRANRRVQQLIEGHTVRLQASGAHSLDGLLGTFEVALPEARFQQGVERHDVGHAVCQGIGHDPLNHGAVLVLDASVQQRVTEARAECRAAL